MKILRCKEGQWFAQDHSSRSAGRRNASLSAQRPCSGQEMALPAFLPEAGELFAQPHSTASSSGPAPARQAPPLDKSWVICLVMFAKLSLLRSLLPMRLFRSKTQRRKCTLAQHFAAPKILRHHSSSYLRQPPPCPCFPLPPISDVTEMRRHSKQVLCHVVFLAAFLPAGSALHLHIQYICKHTCVSPPFSSTAVKLYFIHRIKRPRAHQVLFLAAETKLAFSIPLTPKLSAFFCSFPPPQYAWQPSLCTHRALLDGHERTLLDGTW